MHAAHGTTRNHAWQRETVSPVGLAALVAALHLAVLAGRVPALPTAGRPGTLLVWRVPGDPSRSAGVRAEKAPSRPVKSFAAGQLALTLGMAVVTLARWLQIMRLTGTPGQ